ncbi:hypothetical protein LF1_47130 [Rubripirellula obstinata]|uniref:Uncharacterized protein n=1 Tax=Rubripirellula obstinata TaxID=406547 RepID=A0A5B1CPH3_9BACT|nr:hypothetical protein [Rubripirellula obstinata]KAA1262151.1 hypothetical protein LF1_47130 [Rubripirellula obstinata]
MKDNPAEPESEPESEQNQSSPPAVAPTMRLTRTGLIACLATMVVCGLSVYALFPDSVGGPPLPVLATIELEPVETVSGVGALMTEVVVIENLLDDEIGKLTIDINGQYLYLQNSPLAARERLVMPQRTFTDKRSSARFDPVKYPVEDIVVTGQLPNGARGVSRFEFE